MRIDRLALICATSLALTACGGAGTPPDTEVLRVEAPAKTLSGYGTVSFGEPVGEARTSKSLLIYDPGEGPLLSSWKPASLRVEIDHGPVALATEIEGLPETWDVPQELRVIVVDAGGFEISVECEDELYQSDAGSPAVVMVGDEKIEFRAGVERRCTADLVRGGSNTMFHFSAYGDGVVIGDKSFGESLEISAIE